MFKNILLLATTIFLFSACSKDESVQDSIVGEWDFKNYYSYYYCSECPDPKEKTVNTSDVSNTGTIYKKLMLKDDEQVTLILNYPKYGVNQEEHRGNYSIKNDSLIFTIKEIYFDGVKQTISNSLYIDPELKNTLPFDYLNNKSLNLKFSLQNDKLEIFQEDYDRKGNIVYTDIPSRPSNPNVGNTLNVETRTAKTVKVTYQRK